MKFSCCTLSLPPVTRRNRRRYSSLRNVGKIALHVVALSGITASFLAGVAIFILSCVAGVPLGLGLGALIVWISYLMVKG